MSIFLVPAFLSLMFKLFVLAYVVKGGKVSNVFLSLIGVFAIHNSIELLGFIQHIREDTEAINMVFRLYYVATTYLLLYILLHALSISKLESQKTTTGLIFITSLFSFILLFTDSIVAGQHMSGYTLTADKGAYYWTFASYVLLVLISSVSVLVYGYLNSPIKLDRTRSLYSLFALSPIILVCLILIIFKLINTNINAIAILPIATTLFLFIVLKTETKHQLSDVRRFMPLSLEREASNNFMSMLDFYIKHKDQEDVFKKVQIGVEREIIFYSLKKCNYNVSKTTKMMGLKNRSTLYSMMNRLDIDIKDMKKEVIS